MPDSPPIHYFVAEEPEPIAPEHALWKKELPQNRHAATTPAESLTHGAYFEAVGVFVARHLPNFIVGAASRMAGRKIHDHEISHLNLHLEKHGAFYHPARLVLHLDAERIPFVLNVAASKQGLDTIQGEYANLRKLADRYSPAWVPRVFGCDRVDTGDDRRIDILLGEWFEGFHEFHVSEPDESGQPRIRVWRPHHPDCFLSPSQVGRLFRQMAAILTAYYDVDTTEQIGAWHHAAGDFVVHVEQPALSVRLITVRRYEPLFNMTPSGGDLEALLNTFLIFFLHMAVKLRIDRKEGVGDMSWTAMDVVPDILTGFFEGLRHQAVNRRIAPEMIAAVKWFFAKLPPEDVQDCCMEIVARVERQSPAMPVVRQNLHDHIAAVVQGFRRLQTP